MPRKKLTEPGIEKMAAPKTGRKEIFDTILPGFGLRVTEKGVKSFFVFYRIRGKGVQIRHTLGRYPALNLEQARDEAKAMIRLADKGQDPRVKRNNGRTFKEAVQDFKDKYKGFKKRTMTKELSPRTLQMYYYYLDNTFMSEWAAWPVASITSDDVNTVLEKLKDRPTTANRAWSSIRVFFRWAVKAKYVLASPAKDIEKPEGENQGTRTLTNDEIRRFWQGCDQMGYPFGPLFQLLLLLGRRVTVTALMKKDNIDFDEAVWHIPPKDDKSKTPHTVPLPPLALEILKSLPKIKGPYFFTTTGDKPVSGFSRAKSRIDTLADFSDWKLHDLRRTCRTQLSKIKIPQLIAKLTIGHTIPGIDAVYDQYEYFDERREAIEKWAERIQAIVADNVVMIEAGNG